MKQFLDPSILVGYAQRGLDLRAATGEGHTTTLASPKPPGRETRLKFANSAKWKPELMAAQPLEYEWSCTVASSCPFSMAVAAVPLIRSSSSCHASSRGGPWPVLR